jgi:hypothetical protein
MAFTSAKMGLRIWNLLTDLYDHSQLADNWAKVDYHDHSPGKGVQVPTEGLADGAVTSAKLASSVDPTGAFSTYRTYWRGTWPGAAAASANNYALTPDQGIALPAVTSARALFYIDPADFNNAGRTAYMRLEMDVYVNAVAPGVVSYTAGLYSLSSISGASGSAPAANVGAVIAGTSTAAVSSPAANSSTHVVGTDFAVPTAGFYLVAIAQSAGAAAGSWTSADARLAVRAV